MYYLKDICFLCIKNNRNVQSVLLQDTDGITFNEKLRCFFPEIIDSTPDEHKLSCSECLEKLRISYNFKQSVICNNTVFRDYIDKLECQHKSYQKLLVVLARSKHQILPLIRDFTATTVEDCDEKHNSNNFKIHNEDLNLTSIKQEQLNTRDQSCQLTTNENVGFFRKLRCQPKKNNLKTENIELVDPVTEDIHIEEEPFGDGTISNNLYEESKESEESNSISSDSEHNDQPKQEGTKKRLYKCDECHKAFNTSSTLGRHRRIHSREKPHKCDVRKDHLIIHKRRHDKHIEEKPYQCYICQFKFSFSQNLRRHIRLHTGEKSYHCYICQYKCTNSFDLKCHIRSHTGEKPYHCNICQFKSAKPCNLKRHIRLHTGEKLYHCHICQYKCTNSFGLKCHIRSHTGEKPYQCHICQFKCTSSSSLNNHRRTHSSEKPYQCKHCKRSFRRSSYLRRHLRRLHS